MRLRDLFVGKEVLGSRSLVRKELTLKRQTLFRFDFLNCAVFNELFTRAATGLKRESFRAFRSFHESVLLDLSVTQDCGIPYETENPFKRVKRVIYVHDSRDGLI